MTKRLHEKNRNQNTQCAITNNAIVPHLSRFIFSVKFPIKN